jgi:alpha-beta hydrolase superfamily lysophospholipase
MAQESIISGDGTKLRRRTWTARSEVKGIVAIAHGHGEHSGRYEWLASRLNGAGFTVEAIDARGHGESEGPRVLIRDFNLLVRDFGALCDQILQNEHAPLFMLGHSLGSLVTIGAVLPRQESIAGVILSGNALEGRKNLPSAAIPMLHVLARIMPNLRLLPALNAPDISTDPDVVRTYENDPLVDRGRWRLVTGSEIMKTIKLCRTALPGIHVPLFVIHGDKDRMLSVDGATFAIERTGSADKQLLICPGEYHEPLSGLGKEKAVTALIGWLSSHVETATRSA